MEHADLTSAIVTLPAPGDVMAYAVGGKLVIRQLSSNGGQGYDTTTAHEVQSLLLPNSPKITFTWSWANPFGGERFTTQYRVMYITRSMYTIQEGREPNFPGASEPDGTVYVQGMKIDQSNGPQVTPWLKLNARLDNSLDKISALTWA